MRERERSREGERDEQVQRLLAAVNSQPIAVVVMHSQLTADQLLFEFQFRLLLLLLLLLWECGSQIESLSLGFGLPIFQVLQISLNEYLMPAPKTRRCLARSRVSVGAGIS